MNDELNTAVHAMVDLETMGIEVVLNHDGCGECS